ncbi:MAG TPA: adenylosuccinate lyase [Trueperaceae bacterium]|nr:adenylosuccinate lyase [Trueperaceae bacterium]
MIDRYATPEMRRLWGGPSRYEAWLRVELAATEAWEALGEVPAGTAARIAAEVEARPLDDAFAQRVAEIEATTRHDIVAFTRALAERVGEPARFLHMGLTSTDVVDTAQNLLLREACDLILADLAAFSEALRAKAVRHKHTPTVGRTHGIHAEPMTFGLKFLNFLAALGRDEARLGRARDGIAVAMLSGSVGTYAHVPPEVEARVAARLELAPDPVTNQTVARDRHAELMSALAILGTTIERVALEVRHLQRSEVREAQEGFGAGQTGSSSMPHKKNPIASENLAGVARLLRGNLQAALENVALWHERDISHSSVERVILPDSTTLASYALRRATRVVSELVVDEGRMAANLDLLGGLVYSQRVLHLLIDKGMSREAAYEVVQRNSLQSWDTGRHLRELLAEDPSNLLSASELASAFDPDWYLRHVDSVFARFGL